MEFAEQQLLKCGWQRGLGLGKKGTGITEALKPKLKFDASGLGFNPGQEFSFHWWDHVYNQTARNLSVEANKMGEITVKSTADSTSRKKCPKKRVQNGLYSGFIKGAVLAGSVEKQFERGKSSDEDIEVGRDALGEMSDEQLLKICGGRTAHKGARHGIRMTGKLARVKLQEEAQSLSDQYGVKETPSEELNGLSRSGKGRIDAFYTNKPEHKSYDSVSCCKSSQSQNIDNDFTSRSLNKFKTKRRKRDDKDCEPSAHNFSGTEDCLLGKDRGSKSKDRKEERIEDRKEVDFVGTNKTKKKKKRREETETDNIFQRAKVCNIELSRVAVSNSGVSESSVDGICSVGHSQKSLTKIGGDVTSGVLSSSSKDEIHDYSGSSSCNKDKVKKRSKKDEIIFPVEVDKIIASADRKQCNLLGDQVVIASTKRKKKKSKKDQRERSAPDTCDRMEDNFAVHKKNLTNIKSSGCGNHEVLTVEGRVSGKNLKGEGCGNTFIHLGKEKPLRECSISEGKHYKCDKSGKKHKSDRSEKTIYSKNCLERDFEGNHFKDSELDEKIASKFSSGLFNGLNSIEQGHHGHKSKRKKEKILEENENDCRQEKYKSYSVVLSEEKISKKRKKKKDVLEQNVEGIYLDRMNSKEVIGLAANADYDCKSTKKKR